MSHLSEPEFVDLIEGTLEPSRADHLRDCVECTAQANALRTTLTALATDPGDEPSPFVWNALPARVSAAIDQEPQGSWLVRRPALVALGFAAMLVVVLTAALWRSPFSPGRADDVRTAAAVREYPEVPGDDIELDDAWAVVRTAAGDLDYDAALEAGIAARPGTAEAAAMELSVEERAELARLIQTEIKRAGA
jgi:hypothetical protein